MARLVRFGVSLEEGLLRDFDKHIRSGGYKNRSEAIRDLIRDGFVKKEWSQDKEVAGAVILVYDHHKKELVNRLTSIQHDFHGLVISSQHIHLDHSNCLETVIAKGRAGEIEKMAEMMKAVKGVKHMALSMSTTGRDI